MSRQTSEHMEQVRVFAWIASQIKCRPDMATIFAVPNGGHRIKSTAARLRSEGVISGVPDIIVPIPSGGHPGMVIELKRVHGGRVSANQQKMLDLLSSLGWSTHVCHGASEAIGAIIDYLGLTEEPENRR